MCSLRLNRIAEMTVNQLTQLKVYFLLRNNTSQGTLM